MCGGGVVQVGEYVSLETLEQLVALVVVIAQDGTITTMAGAHALDIEKEVADLLEK